MQKSTNPIRNLSDRWLLGGVLALTAVLTLNGITHDLPYSYNTDEAHFVKRALAFGSGDLNPHWFHKPAFYMYLLFAEYGLLYVAGWLGGWWNSVTDFAVAFVRDPGAFYLLGRLTSAAFGVGTVAGVYFLGERHFARHAGLLGALILALTYGHLESSRIVKADIPTTFFSIWSLYFALNYLRDARWSSLALCCAVAGVGTATKYYTIAMLVPITALVVAVPVREADGLVPRLGHYARRLAFGVGCFFAAYFVCSPYNFLDPLGRQATFYPFETVARRGMALVGGPVEERPGDFINQRTGVVGGAIDYVRVAASHRGMGPVLAPLGLLGLLAFVDPRAPAKWIVLLYGGTFMFASIAMFPGYAQPRHQCPIYPILALAGGMLLVWLADRLPARRPVLLSVLAIALCYPLWHVVGRGLELSRPGTRNVAKAWIEANIAPESRLLVDENGPPLLASPTHLESTIEEARQADPSGQFTAHYSKYLEYQMLAAREAPSYELHEIRFPWWREQFDEEGLHELSTDYDVDISNPLRPVGVEDYDYYVAEGFEYAVVHSNRYDKFFREKNNYNERFPKFGEFYQKLFERATLVKEFSSADEKLRGPTVRIYRFGLQVASDPSTPEERRRL